MIAYSKMTTRPSLAYMLGVFLYLAGYVAFACLTLAAIVGTTLPGCYSAGSLLFAIGSAFLVRATVGPLPPKPWDMVTRGFLASLFGKPWSLFWGSAAFLLGSCAFARDSFFSSPNNAVAGYALFIVGRLFFLWGSTTQEVDIFFRVNRRQVRCSESRGDDVLRERKRFISNISQCNLPYDSLRLL